jgi:hypothetical protein
MSSVAIQGNAAGAGVFTVAAPNSASSYTATLPTATTTLVGTDATQTLTNKTIEGGAITTGTAVASTSGTSISFTSIPSWVKRITVMFSGVSTSGTSAVQIQLGTGAGPTYTTTGYLGSATNASSGAAGSIVNLTTGLPTSSDSTATRVRQGFITINAFGNNTWMSQSVLGDSSATQISWTAGSITLAAALTAVRVTTVNGTDTFDAGSINILYE